MLYVLTVIDLRACTVYADYVCGYDVKWWCHRRR